MKLPFPRAAAIACALACAANVGLPLAATNRFVRASDQNRDGRSDVWRIYDAGDQLVRISIDRNLDGQPDENEHYVNGALVQRERDRNFDDRVDLVEEYVPVTQERVRSVVDVDFDGVADLLVLVQDGRPVFTKWAAATSVARGADAARFNQDAAAATPLTPLADPFLADTTIHAAAAPSASDVSVGGPAPTAPVFLRAELPATVGHPQPVVSVTEPASAPLHSRSPRGPPSIALL